MTRFHEIKVEIAKAVDVIDGLTALPFVPDAIPEPCFYTGETEIVVNNTFGGSDDLRITCTILVSRADDRQGQEALDVFLSRRGAKSVRERLNVARGAPGQSALDGKADDLVIERITGYRYYLVNEMRYFGAQLIVRVIGAEEGN